MLDQRLKEFAAATVAAQAAYLKVIQAVPADDRVLFAERHAPLIAEQDMLIAWLWNYNQPKPFDPNLTVENMDDEDGSNA